MRSGTWIRIATGIAVVVAAGIVVASMARDARTAAPPMATSTTTAPTTAPPGLETPSGEGPSGREGEAEVQFPPQIRTMDDLEGVAYVERVEVLVRDDDEGGLELVHEVDDTGRERYLLERLGGGSAVELIVDGDDTYLRGGDGRWERSAVAGGILEPLAPLGIAPDRLAALAGRVDPRGSETRAGRTVWRFVGGVDAIEAVLADEAAVTDGELTVWVDAELVALVGLSIELDAEGTDGPIRLEATYEVTDLGDPVTVEVPDV